MEHTNFIKLYDDGNDIMVDFLGQDKEIFLDIFNYVIDGSLANLLISKVRESNPELADNMAFLYMAKARTVKTNRTVVPANQVFRGMAK